MQHLNLPVLIGCLLLSGCLTIKTVNISQKTSLEHQLMGSFEPLTEEEMLLSSVRDEAQLLRAEELNEDQAALAARRRQLFNRDDVERFKRLGCLGEALSNQLIARTCDDESTGSKTIIERILTEESRDRETIITWVISQHDHLQEDQRGQVKEIYRQFILSRSPSGTPFQDSNGDWLLKESSEGQN
ncbi:MAG: hypothetical protein HOI23_07265 [Deltaproteobacteria bacterium]|jgi:hypothetical protein|nr:hypothetical protein [Deltaproteobacteria bacterium]MBT6435037.1 hypothetical protein [Deltaproteobacteria bacterium]MBT6491401.1 hypothetical protein [Deltaproteobacteria bacterium]